MDFALVIQAIGSVGFPIVMCLIVFVYTQKADQVHDEEIRRLMEVISENTMAINRMIDRLSERVEGK